MRFVTIRSHQHVHHACACDVDFLSQQPVFFSRLHLRQKQSTRCAFLCNKLTCSCYRCNDNPCCAHGACKRVWTASPFSGILWQLAASLGSPSPPLISTLIRQLTAAHGTLSHPLYLPYSSSFFASHGTPSLPQFF